MGVSGVVGVMGVMGGADGITGVLLEAVSGCGPLRKSMGAAVVEEVEDGEWRDAVDSKMKSWRSCGRCCVLGGSGCVLGGGGCDGVPLIW